MAPHHEQGIGRHRDQFHRLRTRHEYGHIEQHERHKGRPRIHAAAALLATRKQQGTSARRGRGRCALPFIYPHDAGCPLTPIQCTFHVPTSLSPCASTFAGTLPPHRRALLESFSRLIYHAICYECY